MKCRSSLLNAETLPVMKQIREPGIEVNDDDKEVRRTLITCRTLRAVATSAASGNRTGFVRHDRDCNGYLHVDYLEVDDRNT